MEIDKKIFLSYSSKDKEFAIKLKKDLYDNKIDAWTDFSDIPKGNSWDKEIDNVLKQIEILLILLTPSSVSSENVMDEVGLANKLKKRVIPLMLEKCEVPFNLDRKQRIDFTKDYTIGLNQLIAAIQSEELFVPVSPPKSWRGKLKYIFPFVFAALILFVLNLSEFKGVIYNSSQIIGDSILQINFKNTQSENYINMGVSARIDDTLGYKHDFSKSVIFDKIPSNLAFKSNREAFKTSESDLQRIILQPIVERGKYIVRWPIIKNVSREFRRSANFDISFRSYRIEQDDSQLINSRKFGFRDYLLNYYWVSLFVFGILGIFIQLFINKNIKK